MAAEQNPRHEVIKRKPGEGFSFKPVLDGELLSTRGGENLIDEQPFEYEGLCRGVVKVLLVDIETETGSYYAPEPLEPVRFTYEIPDMTAEVAEITRCSILYRGERYQGRGAHDRGHKESAEPITLHFWDFRPVDEEYKDDDFAPLLFPPNTNFEDDVIFLIERGTGPADPPLI